MDIGKPGAVVSASPGGTGGFGTSHRLRQSLVVLNVPAMAQPEAYLGHADKLFDASGKLVNDGTRKFLGDFMIQGGVEWNGAAFSPETNSLFVAAVDWCAHVQVKRNLEVPASGGLGWLGNENPMTDMYDPVDQAKGWLTAFDAKTGSVRWKYHAPHPMLAGVTPTAGGLVFAADLGGQIYAVDADTGSILWQSSTGQSTGGGIVTYRAGGRQLIGVASGMKSPVWPGGAQQSRILVYGLR